MQPDAGAAQLRQRRAQGLQLRVGRMALRQGAQDHGAPRSMRQRGDQRFVRIRHGGGADARRHRLIRRAGRGMHQGA